MRSSPCTPPKRVQPAPNMYASPEASRLLAAAQAALGSQSSAVLVTVAATRGSAPRHAGAAMLVLGDADSVTPTVVGTIEGTVGGGHLEYLAVQHARGMLGGASSPQEIDYPLGASLGQCCGGAMRLRYQRLSTELLPMLAATTTGWKTLYLFGAGHVAQALVRALSPLPLNIVWVDTRDAVNEYTPTFPSNLPAQVRCITTDTPESEFKLVLQGSLALIATHSHALDQSLVAAALSPDNVSQFAYIGLIGSATKRRLFTQRLAAQGVAAASLDQLVCPIGLAGVEPAPVNPHRQDPAVIAAQVAAQLCGFL